MTNDPPNPKRRPRRWRVTGMVMSFLALNWYLVAASDVIPPRDQTRTAMAVLEQRLRLAVESKLEIPTNLKDLPTIAGKASAATDAWGHPIVLDDSGPEIMLISYGKDGRPGGLAEDADIIHRFSLKE